MGAIKGFFLVALGVIIGIIISTAQTGADIEVPYTPSAIELMSPANHISENQIHVYQNRIVIDVDAEWARIADTNSMDPILDKGANALQIIPKDESIISVGDIISYELDGKTIIHRVIEKGFDKEGTYFITKGDNNPVADPEKVRFSQVRKVLIGIIY